MKKILVTGAAGFIGSHLTDAVLARGMTVLGIDNLKLGRREYLAQALQHPRFKFFENDLNDLAACRKIIAAESQAAPFDTVWHLAANSDIRAGVTDPDVDLRDTFLTTHGILKLMREFRIPAIAFSSTSAIYGVHDQLLTEDMGPLFPISNYGAMKLAAEAAISAALEAYLERAWIFRFPNVVGSRATHGAIYDFARKLKKNPAELEVLGDGSQEKPYFHVADLIDAMLFITENAQRETELLQHRHSRQRYHGAPPGRIGGEGNVAGGKNPVHRRQPRLGGRCAKIQLLHREAQATRLVAAADFRPGGGPRRGGNRGRDKAIVMSRQLVIVAGGAGTRLRARLGDLPKPMIPIAGKPLLEHQVELARQHGFADLIFFVCITAPI